VRPRDPAEAAAELEGETVAALERRGKYLVVRFERDLVLLIHLRMTGSLQHAPGGRLEDDPHLRAVVTLDDRSDVIYRDVRRFGTWEPFDAAGAAAHLAVRLGPEPLGRAFTPSFLSSRLDGRSTPVKAAILDQRTVAGLGNIYADEALWHAGIHPLRPAGELRRDESKALRDAVREALLRGIGWGGTDLGDGVIDAAGVSELKAYGRGGEPCERCGTPIARAVVSGRGTWFCPRCQGRTARRSRSVLPRSHL